MSHAVETMVRDLHRRRARERRGLSLAEGVRLVEEVLAADRPVRAALAAPGLEATERGRRLRQDLNRLGDRLHPVEDDALARLATTDQSQGVLVVFEPPAWSLTELPMGPGDVILVLDAVQDPGNVGTLLRTAFALGASGVAALPGTAELVSPKVLRASMGASFRLPVAPVSARDLLDALAGAAGTLWVTDARAEPPPRPGRGPLAIAVGNEGAGISEALAAAASRHVGIPLRAGAESINVAVAAGILLHEVLRAR